MNVELAEERILVLNDRFSMEYAEGRAWTKRIEAFGTLAKLTGFLARPKDEDFIVAYRERRLQPFYRIACASTLQYERRKRYRVGVEANVTEVTLDGTVRAVGGGAFEIEGVEHCCDRTDRETLFDGISGQVDAGLAPYLRHESTPGDAETLAAAATAGTVVVPPEARASMLVRDVLAGAIQRIAADRVLEETVALHHVDLIYRPIYAVRYRWQGKEAVVEVDGVTGEPRTGGKTFEQFVGRRIDAEFLINAGVEAAGIFIPGARLAEIVVTKAIKAREARS